MKKFSELLSQYLDLRDKINSDYFDNRYIGERSAAVKELSEVAEEMDEMFANMEFDIETAILTGKE